MFFKGLLYYHTIPFTLIFYDWNILLSIRITCKRLLLPDSCSSCSLSSLMIFISPARDYSLFIAADTRLFFKLS